MSGKFTHLHVHSEYSLLDGFSRIDALIDKAIELNMDSVAITDHGVMFGVVDFFKACKRKGIKPIIGCEVYVAPRNLDQKDARLDTNPSHLILLAKNLYGYKNLMQIVSKGFIDGFYYKPRVDHQFLRKHSEGLICLSACLGGEIPKCIIQGNVDKAKELCLLYVDMFGKDFYLELQNHNMEAELKVNQKLVEFSKEMNIPLVATNDVHYINQEDSVSHDVLLCVQTATNIDDSERMKFPNNEFYFKSYEEMYELFKYIPEALENTNKIAEECNVEYDFETKHLPKYNVPQQLSSKDYLKKLCYKGLNEKFNNVDQVAIDRLEYELSVINQMGYDDYFLIVWDFIKYAKDNGIMVGPGRGSAAGSLVSYCLDITTIDPLKYNLIFERFLNPNRVTMPDIDIDFCYERRQEVIDYVIDKYGEDHVAQIITFGTMAARAAIRDVGRAVNMPYSQVDKVAKQIPMELGMNINKALQINSTLKDMCEQDSEVDFLIKMSKSMEGLARHASTHAAGVVISNKPIVEHVPLYKNNDSITTQFTMTLLEELGLLKMDFLGLRTLTVIRDAIENIKHSKGIQIDLSNLNFDDSKVFKLISSGDTLGVFQLESKGMQQFMKDLSPDSFEDIIAGISLYRPGPMDQIPTYIKNKRYSSNIPYLHPILEPILNVTYGCMVYQEQVMQIVRDVAGYSMGRSDLVRRAMSKKKMKVMEAERQVFIYGEKDKEGNVIVEGAVRRGVSEKVANEVYDQMIDFAKYAFNKSHAAAYAVIAYQTAWLKKYYPVEFMAALLTSVMGNDNKVAQYIRNCKNIGIQVLPPDINESFVKFTVVSNNIRFGLAAVKNVGENAIKSLIDARQKKGNFINFTDFCEKVDFKILNKRAVESLIKCGAFDSFNVYRSQLMAIYDKTIDQVLKDRKNNIAGQTTLFDLMSEQKKQDIKSNYLPELKEFDEDIKLSMEKEMLGLYISGHPLQRYVDVINRKVSVFSSQINSYEDMKENQIRDGQSVIVGGLITNKRNTLTKKNNLMSFITLEDLYGNIEVIVFPKILEEFSFLLNIDSAVLIKGKLNYNEDKAPVIICEQVTSLESQNLSMIKDQFKDKKLAIVINSLKDDRLKQIKKVLKASSGDNPVILCILDNKKKLMANKELWVKINNELINSLIKIIGKDNVIIY